MPWRPRLASALGMALFLAATGRVRAAPIEAGFVDVPNGRLWYDARGAGDALVFVHDGLLPSETWDAQVDPFARYFRVVRYDRRHYGRSETKTEDYSDAADLLAVLDRLGVRQATLVGCSSGGGLVLDFALAYPQRVTALVLVGPVVSGLGFSTHFGLRGLVNRLPALLSGDRAAAVANWARDPYLTDVSNAEARARVQALLERYPDAASGGDTDGRPPERPALGRLGEIRAPTLIVAGTSDIPDVQAHIGAIAAGIPHGERELVPAAGHLVHLEKPQAFNDRVLDFLAPPARAHERLEALTRGGLPPGSLHAFEYDSRASLDVQESRREARPQAELVELSYVSPGGRVPADLILPAQPGRHAGVLLLHHGQGNRKSFVDEALALAARGVVSLSIDAPDKRPGYQEGGPWWEPARDRAEIVQTVVDLRRGLDLLASRPEVDASRLAYVGYSLGATMGARLVALEPRLRAAVLTAGYPALSHAYARGYGRGGVAFRALLSADAQRAWLDAIAPLDGVRFLAAAPPACPVLLQYARADEFISRMDAALFQTVLPDAKVTWYDGGHFSLGSGPPLEERTAFLTSALTLRAAESGNEGPDQRPSTRVAGVGVGTMSTDANPASASQEP